MILERGSKNKKVLLAAAIAILFFGFLMLINSRLGEDLEEENRSWDMVAAELKECLPKSDMASYEKCAALLAQIKSFDACVAVGFSIMKSNPPQCVLPNGRIFLEEIN